MDPPAPPPWPLDERLRKALGGDLEQTAQLIRWFQTGLTRSFLVDSERVGAAPLETSWLRRTLGRGARPPALPLLASKLGGRPYLERPSDWPAGYRFVGQIDFSSLPETLPQLPRRGLLGLFLSGFDQLEPLRVVWYDAPHESKAAPAPADGRCSSRFEARLHFHPVWMPPETEAGRVFPRPEDDDELFEAVLEWTSRFLEQQGYRDGVHFLGPPTMGALTDQFRPDELESLATVLRLDSDPGAELQLGSNVIYLMTARQDLAEGRLDRCFAVVTGY